MTPSHEGASRAPSDWLTGPPQLPLPAGEVHVWAARLNRPVCEGEATLAGLSAGEVSRARAAALPRVRDRFVRTRLVLRDLLSRYLGLPAATISLQLNTHGKPSLAERDGGKDQTNGLQFNVSHTDEFALLAFARGRPVGIDVDSLERISDWRGIARSSFSPAEQAALERLPEAGRGTALMRGWIRKEAYTKARGAGYAYGFQAFSVALDERRESPLLLDDQLDALAISSWRLVDLDLSPPLSATLAIEGDIDRLRCWRWGAPS